MTTKDEDLKIAKALGFYERLNGASDLPDALGDRYRTDIDGKAAFKRGWKEAELHLTARAYKLIVQAIATETARLNV